MKKVILDYPHDRTHVHEEVRRLLLEDGFDLDLNDYSHFELEEYELEISEQLENIDDDLPFCYEKRIYVILCGQVLF